MKSKWAAISTERVSKNTSDYLGEITAVACRAYFNAGISAVAVAATGAVTEPEKRVIVSALPAR